MTTVAFATDITESIDDAAPGKGSATVEYESAGKLAEKLLEVLDQRGWIRGDVEDYHGHVCLVGALGLAYGQSPFAGYDMNDVPVVAQVASRVTEYLSLRGGQDPYRNYTPSPAIALYRFNDTYASDVTDVELALEYVIEREKQSV